MSIQGPRLFEVAWWDDVAILTLVHDENGLGEQRYRYEFGRELREFLENRKPRCVIIDQAHLMAFGPGEPVCTSAMNGLFASFLWRAKQLGIELRLCRVAPPIRSVYKLNRIDTLIPIYESLQDAISALPAPGSEPLPSTPADTHGE